MKIWYGITTVKYLKYRSIYKQIREHLIETGNILTHDWFTQVEPEFRKNPKLKEKPVKRDMKKIYDGIIKAIDEADVVIIEFTVPNFSTAHQINYAIFKRKPTLVLRLKKDNPYFTDSYIEAIDSELLKVVEYEAKNIKEVLDNFLGESSIGYGSKRYNLVLNKKQDHYLDWLATFKSETRSKVLRDIIDKSIKQDRDFAKSYKELLGS